MAYSIDRSGRGMAFSLPSFSCHPCPDCHYFSFLFLPFTSFSCLHPQSPTSASTFTAISSPTHLPFFIPSLTPGPHPLSPFLTPPHPTPIPMFICLFPFLNPSLLPPSHLLHGHRHHNIISVTSVMKRPHIGLGENACSFAILACLIKCQKTIPDPGKSGHNCVGIILTFSCYIEDWIFFFFKKGEPGRLTSEALRAAAQTHIILSQRGDWLLML